MKNVKLLSPIFTLDSLINLQEKKLISGGNNLPYDDTLVDVFIETLDFYKTERYTSFPKSCVSHMPSKQYLQRLKLTN